MTTVTEQLWTCKDCVTDWHGMGKQCPKCGSNNIKLVLKATLRDFEKHPQAKAFINSKAKRKVLRCGRRGAKTVAAATNDTRRFLAGRRVLYAAPTSEQVGTYWYEIKRALRSLIDAKVFKCNETEHFIELENTKQRIKAKTAWNADSLRGDYADDLTLDEFQLMNEDAWEIVGAPMLLDNDGDATFIYTPPSLLTSGVSKARDPRHAAKMYKAAQEDKSGRWETFHWTSHDNPFISSIALAELTKDMSADSYRREIMAEDDDSELNQLVFGGFNPLTQLIDPIPLSDRFPCYTGHDFGAANPAALIVRHDIDTGNFYVTNEYFPGLGLDTAKHVQSFKEITAGLRVLRSVGGNPNSEDEIRQGYTAHGWTILAPKWKHVNKQLEMTISLMERNKVFVFNTCRRFVQELLNCLWEIDKDGIRLDKIRNEKTYHLIACARYLLSEFTPETLSSDAPQVVHTLWAGANQPQVNRTLWGREALAGRGNIVGMWR